MQAGVVDKSGAWLLYGEDKLGQGRERAKQYLRENPALAKTIEAKVRAHFNVPTLSADGTIVLPGIDAGGKARGGGGGGASPKSARAAARPDEKTAAPAAGVQAKDGKSDGKAGREARGEAGTGETGGQGDAGAIRVAALIPHDGEHRNAGSRGRQSDRARAHRRHDVRDCPRGGRSPGTAAGRRCDPRSAGRHRGGGRPPGRRRPDPAPLCGVRPRTSHEVREFLSRHGHAPATVRAVLDELEAKGLVDDARYAAYFVQARLAHRPMGAARLKRELRSRGVTKELAEEARAAPAARTRRNWRWRRRGPRFAAARRLGRERGMRRLAAFLARRGFSEAVVRETCLGLFAGEPRTPRRPRDHPASPRRRDPCSEPPKRSAPGT